MELDMWRVGAGILIAMAAATGIWCVWCSRAPAIEAAVVHVAAKQGIDNADLERPTSDGRAPDGFRLAGDIAYGPLGAASGDNVGRGVRLSPVTDLDGDGRHHGSITRRVSGLQSTAGRWFRFQIRGLAQDGFTLADGELLLKVDFLSRGGASPLDGVSKNIYPLIEQARRDLTANGNHRRHGAETWKTYSCEFRLPFAEVDTLDLGVVFRSGAEEKVGDLNPRPRERSEAGGEGGPQGRVRGLRESDVQPPASVATRRTVAKSAAAEFWIDAFDIERIEPPLPVAPAAVAQPADAKGDKVAQSDNQPPQVPFTSLVPLGGRWYALPDARALEVARAFDRQNADRLFYHAAQPETPFAKNMTAWLRPGFLDREGSIVREERFVPDNLIIAVSERHLVVRAKNLPNHPTGVFPDRERAIDGNPHFIQELDNTYYLPLEPRVDPDHVAMTKDNANGALPMGPIGIAINGVVFYNPFDRDMVDATSIMDRCCGHPDPRNRYHYHKYPVCVRSPWDDAGDAHSPVIGFAFDGFPIYGPYEAAGVMAKDSQQNPLNDFNIHFDDERGWHYHVTPGKFPYVIGGYWGVVEARNLQRRPPGGGPPPGGPPGGRPPRG